MKPHNPATIHELKKRIMRFSDIELCTQFAMLSPQFRLVESRFRDKERNLTLRFKQ
jgi:hypothetical protein